ncbi:MAG: beta-lactamase family protein [Bacteroidia bacterium]|nr:beta-lactamase family protein [Bacteroidia bacterium]
MQPVLRSWSCAVLFSIIYSFTGHAQQDSIQNNYSKLEQLTPFIDSVTRAGMEEHKIPGAIIAIISDSSEVYYQGYGYANVETKKPVDKDSTLFRIASITKTFTALAALQLVEAGKLDLDVDIRTYLPDDDFDFLNDTPITLHQLLTHTAGFDLTDTGDAALSAKEAKSIEKMARRHMPNRVHEPGSVYSYSNFGYTLVGYLIQAVSGIPYEEYMIQNALKPLGMNQTGIHQPLPEHLQKYLSRSYEWDDGQKRLIRDYTNTLPGGGIISSAGDMVRYIRMHLNEGMLDSVQLLSSEGHRQLTSAKYGSKRTKYSICYAFYENRWTGRRSIEHSGGQLGFVSLMILIPETGTGIFIAQNNRKNAGGFRYDVARAVLDTLVGKIELNIPPLVPPENFDAIADNYVGVYKQMDYPKSTFEKAIRLFGQFSTEYKIQYVGDGRLETYGDMYVQVDDHIFQLDSPKSTYKLSFDVDETGKAQRLNIGVSSYERISWWEKKRVQQMFLFLSLVILLILFFSRPIYWLYRKLRKKEARKFSRECSRVRNWIYWTGSFLIMGALGIIVNFAVYRDQLADYGVPWSFKLVLVLCTIGFGLSLLFPYFLWKNWRLISFSKSRRWINTLFILASIIVSVIYAIYRLIGFQYYN